MLILALLACDNAIDDTDVLLDDTDVNLDDTDVEPPGTCDAFPFRDEVYDCREVDRCDASADNLTFRLACCECEPEFCQPSPDCPPPSG